MSRVKEFLSKLDDHELAYFVKFKLSTYLKPTQAEIRAYLIERNLNERKFDDLIANNPKSKLTDNQQRCPRCFSDKIRRDKVEWTETADRIGYSDEIAVSDGLRGKATYKNEVICNVCGFWLEDPNKERKRSLKQKFVDFLGKIFG